MGSSFRLTLVTILALVVVVGLALFGSSRVTTQASGTTLNLSMKPRGASSPLATSCGSWSIVPSPNVGADDNTLKGIITVSTTNIWAVGSYYNASDHKEATLIEHWDGTQWSIVSSPNPSMNSTLFRVAVVSARNIWAVGYDYPGSGPSQPLIEHWNGSQWYIVPTPNIPGSLQGIKVISARDIWAVGYDSSNPAQTLIEHWDGTQWSVVSSPNVRAGDNILTGVARDATTNQIWAAGYYWNANTSSYQTLIEFYCE